MEGYHRVQNMIEGKPLSPKEGEILKLMAQAKPDIEIGAIMCYSLSTVKNVISKIYRKLNICTGKRYCSRIRAIVIGLDIGYVTPRDLEIAKKGGDER